MGQRTFLEVEGAQGAGAWMQYLQQKGRSPAPPAQSAALSQGVVQQHDRCLQALEASLEEVKANQVSQQAQPFGHSRSMRLGMEKTSFLLVLRPMAAPSAFDVKILARSLIVVCTDYALGLAAC